MRAFLFGLAASAVFVLAADARAQRGGFGGPPDADRIWQFMAGGDVPSINLNQRTDIRDRILQRGGTIPPDGILTKEAFKADFEKRMAQGGGFGGRGPQPPAPAIQGTPPAPGGGLTDDQIRDVMKRYDKNGDGRITADEASERLKPVFAQFDKNGDGAIDAAEYRPYLEERMGRRPDGGQPPGSPPVAPGTPPQQYGGPPQPQYGRPDKPPEDEPVVRPTVIRYGKLPKEVPSWFEQLDTDADGQVGLYEWRQAGRATAEFAGMDLNGDGYLTAEEWVRFTKLALEKKPDTLAAVDGGSSGGRGGPPPGKGWNRDRGDDRSKDDKKAEKDERRNPFTGR